MVDKQRKVRERTCEICGESFSYEVARGADRRMCSDFCRTRKRHAMAKAQPICCVEGCLNHRYYSSGLCNSCYYRMKRTGTLERRQYNYRCVASNGYVKVCDKGHPLAVVDGWLYEHRKVLYDVIGPGPHQCYWCKANVDWVKGKCVKGSLVPDHLDGVKTNNTIGNLVPACNRCNASRGLFMSWVRAHQDDPVLREMFMRSQAPIARWGRG